MSTEFKPGDRVRRIIRRYGNCSVGEAYVVHAVTRDGLQMYGDKGFYDPTYFTLVAGVPNPPQDTAANPLETQVGGGHYKDYPIQPIEYSMANKLDACQHSVVKYVTRFRAKGSPIADLQKARHFIDMLIAFENATPTTTPKETP